jgi:simple sugar transport system substrate-binding protein
MAAYTRYGVQVPHNVNSGPGFITKDNIEKVAKLAGEYR